MRKARILILRGGAVGDFIVTLPALQALRRQWPDAYIELIGYPHVAGLARHAGLIDKLRSLDEAKIARYFSPNAILDDGEQTHLASFDIVLNYLYDPDGTLNGNLKRFGAQVLITAEPLVSECHAVEHFTRPLQSLAIYNPPAYPVLNVPEPADRPQQLPAHDWIAIHPGSGGRKKLWPFDRFIEMAEYLRANTAFTPVFISSDVETEYIPGLHRRLAPYPHLHNVELIRLAGLLASATLYVGNDGGITHLAAALGRPTVALFGPSDENTWAPRGPKVKTIAAPDRKMESITTADVIRNVTSWLSGGW